MAPRKAVSSLQHLSLQTIRSAVLSTTRHQSSVFDGAKRLETLRILLTSYIPKCHHMYISEVCFAGLASLYSADNLNSSLLITDEFFKWREEIANLLFCVFSCLEPLIINIDQWCDVTLHKLIQQSSKLWNTTIFSHCNSTENESREFIVKEVLLDGPVWMHLQSFTMLHCCTDKIISTLNLNSPFLCLLDVEFSTNVTDNCVNVLTKFRHLQTLHVSGTKITPQGLATFLTKSGSNSLFELGFLTLEEGHFFEKTLVTMEALSRENARLKQRHVRSGLKFKIDEISEDIKFLPSRQIQQLRCRCLCLMNVPLRLLGKYFPSVSKLNLVCDEVDLGVGALQRTMRNLENFCLMSPIIPSTTFRSSLMSCGSLITSLDVLFNDQSILNVMMLTLPGSCPNLVKLKLRQEVSFEEDLFSPPLVRFSPPPFMKLKSLTWLNCSYTSFAENILIYAPNIEKIHIKANLTSTFLFNQFLLNVVEFNSLSQLKKLKVMHPAFYALSFQVFVLLLSTFQNLSIITCNMDPDKRDAAESYIKENNYDVKFKIIS